jgi:hypothetical protein
MLIDCVVHLFATMTLFLILSSHREEILEFKGCSKCGVVSSGHAGLAVNHAEAFLIKILVILDGRLFHFKIGDSGQNILALIVAYDWEITANSSSCQLFRNS